MLGATTWEVGSAVSGMSGLGQLPRLHRLSRTASAGLSGDVVFSGNRRGSLTLRWVLLHVLRELAQHCGHADILREQLLARRNQ